MKKIHILLSLITLILLMTGCAQDSSEQASKEGAADDVSGTTPEATLEDTQPEETSEDTNEPTETTQEDTQPEETSEDAARPAVLTITSTAFAHNGNIPSRYTCDGENVNPPLDFSGLPSDAVSLVLIVDDPDAPVGTWDHWVVWNIGPVTGIAEDSVPSGAVEGKSSFSYKHYGGPCPPSGTHRYFFKLYALDTTLKLDAWSDKKAVEDAMKGHVLAKAELIGLYSRQG